MSSRIKFILLPLIVVFCAGFFAADSDVFFKMSKSIDIFGKVYKEVSFNYVDNIDPEEFMISGINGMLSSLDPYTVFIDEKRKDDIDLLTNGKYGGIGVSIGIRNDRVTIVDLIDGYTAQRQGLRIGDIILKVNNVEITKDNFDDISGVVKGDPGTEVKLEILRDSEVVVYNLIREEVKVKNLTFYGFVPEESGNAYLKLVTFTRTAGDEIKRALSELRAQKEVKSIVLDLRGNPGGLLDAAVDVCEKFLKKNQLIVTIKGRDTSGIKKYYSTEEPVGADSKMVVLVDSGSASASEIVAGAIQDHDRGVILGTPTFGKGLVQTVVPLSYNTSLKITTAKYFTPSGRCIQKIDYSRGNKIIAGETILPVADYSTDNKRKVYASGGIKPDTLVESPSESNIVTELASKGFFFKFANLFYARYNKDNFYKTSDEKIFNELNQFIDDQKFEYNTTVEKQMLTLIKSAETEKYSKSLIDELSSIKKKLKELKDHELNLHKQEIIDAAKDELNIRYDGQSGRIKQSLQNDKQFKAALDVVKNDKFYNHLLTH